jgi:hypothetical protein
VLFVDGQPGNDQEPKSLSAIPFGMITSMPCSQLGMAIILPCVASLDFGGILLVVANTVSLSKSKLPGNCAGRMQQQWSSRSLITAEHVQRPSEG